MGKGKQGILCARPQYLMLECRDDEDRMPAFGGPQQSSGREGGREEGKGGVCVPSTHMERAPSRKKCQKDNKVSSSAPFLLPCNQSATVSGWHRSGWPEQMTSKSFPGLRYKNHRRGSKPTVLGCVWRERNFHFWSLVMAFPLLFFFLNA